MPKRQRNSKKHLMFVAEKGVSGQARVHVGSMSFSLKMGKKMLSEEILSSFTKVLLMKLGGGGEDRHTLHTCKMKEIGRTVACPWWEGVGAKGLTSSRKKEAVRGNFNLFHLYFTNEIMGEGDRHICKIESGPRTGACPWWGGGTGALPPLEMGKKMLSEKNLTSFTYILLHF